MRYHWEFVSPFLCQKHCSTEKKAYCKWQPDSYQFGAQDSKPYLKIFYHQICNKEDKKEEEENDPSSLKGMESSCIQVSGSLLILVYF